MLAATIYFYDISNALIEEMDLYEYDKMSKEAFLQYIEKLHATRVTIGSVSNNYQSTQYVEELYNIQTATLSD